MNGLRIGKVLGWCLVLVSVSAATRAFAQAGGLTGKASLQDGNPCAKCTVVIDRLDIKGHYTVKTDKKGDYVYIGLPIGAYKITLQDANGRTLYFFNNKHVGLGDPTQVDFDLKKEAGEQAKEQQANPQFQKQEVEQQKEQKQFTGLKTLFDQGNALYAQAKYAEAAAQFEQAVPLAKDKNLVVVLGRLGECYSKAKEYDKAVDAFQKAVAASPSDANLHNSLGNTYASMNKTPEAVAEFQKAATLNPTGASTYYFNLGAIMYNAGKMDEAVAAFKKASEADPKYADAFFMEGRALMGKLDMDPKTGKVIAAPGTVEALQEYLKLDPSGKYAADAQQMVQTITGSVQTEVKIEKKKKKGS